MAHPGVKHSGTLCTVDNTGNKAGWVQGPWPAQMGGRRSAPWAGGPGSCAAGAWAWGSTEGPALQPASWGFCKYLPNKETTAFAFPVIVAPAPPPWVQAGEAPGPALPTSPPPALTSPFSGGQGWVLGRHRLSAAQQSGTQGPPLPRGQLDILYGNLASHPDTAHPLLPVTWGQRCPRNLRCPQP